MPFGLIHSLRSGRTDDRRRFFTLIMFAGLLLFVQTAIAARTTLLIEKTAVVVKTILSSKDVNRRGLEVNLPEYGKLRCQLRWDKMKVFLSNKTVLILTIACIIIVLFAMPAMAATTQVHVARYASDGTTILNETTVTYQWMEANLPVLGDGITHYYLQGPVFVDNSDEATEQALRWNPEEDTNVDTKGMGALIGTNVKDLCDLVGGMSPGDEVKILSADGWGKRFAYKNVYEYTSRDGPMVLAWYSGAETPDTWEPQGVGYVPDYYTGMRLVWFADTGVNPSGIHALGNYDWHEAADSQYWYYYASGGEKYPTTTGLSGKYISDILIYSGSTAQGESPREATTSSGVASTQVGISPIAIACELAACGFLAYVIKKRGYR